MESQVVDVLFKDGGKRVRFRERVNNRSNTGSDVMTRRRP